MRISDWSSDVCSSDLHQAAAAAALLQFLRGGGDDARAGRRERVAGRQRRTIDVELRRIDLPQRRIEAEAGPAVILALPGTQRAQHLRGEGFVDLVQVEVLQAQAVALAHLRPRDGRSEEHTSEPQST